MNEPQRRERDWLSWLTLALGIVGLVVVAWISITEWGGVVHGNPTYAVWLGITAIASLLTALAGWRGRKRGAWRSAWRVTGVMLGVAWLLLTGWLQPHSAVEPALAAMKSDATVSVTETATEIVLTPRHGVDTTGVFFQPGALVDARAYAAVLRPLAADGHTVVIVKQPLGIAFLATGALDSVRSQFPKITGWIVGGHSLGGTVAAIEADTDDTAAQHPAVGLMFYASYPANDISTSLTVPVLSVSASRDGLATPAKINASRPNLPSSAVFVVIRGAVHAQFGAYGPQSGDGTPTISDADARKQISDTSVQWVDSLGG